MRKRENRAEGAEDSQYEYRPKGSWECGSQETRAWGHWLLVLFQQRDRQREKWGWREATTQWISEKQQDG